MPRYFDISVPVASGGAVYPGNPEIRIEPQQEMATGGSSNVSSLAFGSHTGTHVDAPLHMIPGGTPVDALPLDLFIGPAVLVRLADDVMAIGADHLRPHEEAMRAHGRVLLRSRNSAFVRGRDFVRDYTYVAPDAAEYLVALGVRLVGVDYFSIEQFHSGHHRTHRTLLERGIVIVEGLDLSAIEPGDYAFCCLPLRLEGLDGAPARAVLMKPELE